MEKIQEDKKSDGVTTLLRQIFLIVFAAVALLMTAYATSGGLRIFLTEPYAWIGITALSVGFLAFTSLVLGDGISSNKVSQIVLITPFFLIAVAICWILSFTSYHQQFLSVGRSDLANAETNLRQMGVYAHDVTKAMNDRVEEQRTALLDGEVFTNYSTQIIDFADELKDKNKQEEINQQLQLWISAKREELIIQQAKLESDKGRISSKLETLKSNIGQLEKVDSETQAALLDAQSLVQKLELAVNLEEGDSTLPFEDRPYLERDGLARQVVDAPACNRRRASGKGGEIPGTCYFALTEKLAETRVLADQNKAALEISGADLDRARQIQTKELNTLNELLAQFETDKLKSSEEFATDFNADSENFLTNVNTFIAQPSETTFKSTARYCQNVTDVLSDLNTDFEPVTCEPQALLAVFERINSVDEELNLVSTACDEIGRRELIIEDLRYEIQGLSGPERLKPIDRAYGKMSTEVLEVCFVAAEQQGLTTGPIRKNLANLYDQINPSQDPISKAIGKVTSLFVGTASARDYFPALLALLQELSLLLAKLFWDANTARKPKSREYNQDYSDVDLEARSDDPAAVLAAKNLLLNTTFYKHKHLLPSLFDDEYSHQMRNHMRLIVDSLLNKGLATNSKRGVLISEEGMEEIARQIRKHNQKLQMASVDAISKRNAPDPVEITKPEKKSTAVVANANKVEEPEPVNDKESNVDANSTAAEEVVQQKTRKRRPIVVRPNFRREV